MRGNHRSSVSSGGRAPLIVGDVKGVAARGDGLDSLDQSHGRRACRGGRDPTLLNQAWFTSRTVRPITTVASNVLGHTESGSAWRPTACHRIRSFSFSNQVWVQRSNVRAQPLALTIPPARVGWSASWVRVRVCVARRVRRCADPRFATSATRLCFSWLPAASGGSRFMRADSSPGPLARTRATHNQSACCSVIVSRASSSGPPTHGLPGRRRVFVLRRRVGRLACHAG